MLLPIPTTTPLSYPITSPPFRRLLCMPTLCCPAATALVVLLCSYLHPPHPPCLHLTRLRVTVDAATDPYYHHLVLPRHQPTLPSPPMPKLCCPAATALVVLLRSYLQPPYPPCLLSTRLRVAVGAATDPYYHSLVLPRHQSTLPSPPVPSYTMLPCSPQLPTPRLPPSVFPRSSFGSTADHGHYH